ncbi:MAG: cupin domain-containing protein [Candidatus Heimdallarchaeota archaeon]|nr:cupin domain-containing protein [Candidatus Heimdallarchaeota archaeon]
MGTEAEFQSLELIDVMKVIESCEKDWQNRLLCEMNDFAVRLAVIKGDFFWHSHQTDDEFFYVIEGTLFIDVADEVIELGPNQAFLVPKGTNHRTRAPDGTSVLVFEKSSTILTGD